MKSNDITAIIKAFMRPYYLQCCIHSAIDAGIRKILVGYDEPRKLE